MPVMYSSYWDNLLRYIRILLSLVLLCSPWAYAADTVAAAANADQQAVEDLVVLQKAAPTAAQQLPSIPGLSTGGVAAPPLASSRANQDGAPASTPASYTDTSGRILPLPNLNKPIVDSANVLSADQQFILGEKLRSLHSQGLAQIGIVIVPTTGIEDIFSYSMRVANSWQLGSAKLDNGLLIVVAVADRKIQILTGYGLEGVIPDLIAKRVIDNHITPQFKQGNYYQGLSDGVTALQARLSQDPELRKQADAQAQLQRQQQAASAQLGNKLVMLFIGLIVLSFIAKPIMGRFISSTSLGVVGATAATFMGLPILTSLLFGGFLMILLLIGIGNILTNAVVLSGGGSSRGGFGGGGFSGGGGGFGGGGGSGAW